MEGGKKEGGKCNRARERGGRVIANFWVFWGKKGVVYFSFGERGGRKRKMGA